MARGLEANWGQMRIVAPHMVPLFHMAPPVSFRNTTLLWYAVFHPNSSLQLLFLPVIK